MFENVFTCFNILWLLLTTIRYNKTTEHFPYTIPIIYLLNTELLLKFSSRIIYKLNQLEKRIFLFNFKLKKIDLEFFTIKKT